MSFLSSERVDLRKFTYSDLDSLYLLDSNIEVMKYISNGMPMTKDQVQTALKNIILRYNDWKHFGVWAAVLKDTDEFIGWFALKPIPKVNEIEVGYRLLPEFWNLGFATEVTNELIDYGFIKLELEKIVAIAMPENKASRRVLLKAGLFQVGLIKNPFGTVNLDQVVYYEILKKTYLRNKDIYD